MALPSRRKSKSAPHRFAAAQLHKKITDSIERKHPNSKLISMGDFNDNPNDKSLQWIMEREKNWIAPMAALAKKGVGSLAHNDRWYLFDQLLFSPQWKTNLDLKILNVNVYRPQWLHTRRGRYQGYPFRTHSDGYSIAGYSDHFPVYALIGERVR